MGPAGANPLAERVEAEALARISPDPDLLARVRKAIDRLTARATDVAAEIRSPMLRCLVAGSAARGTFLADRLDIDFFMLFPPQLDRDGLERAGMELARRLLENPETRYAEHPYLRGTFDGFAVDAVPGYAVEDPSQPLSAVDRTPFHQRYLESRTTPGHAAQIRLAKQFLRSLGAYGSEARTGGFSGYLVELLVLRFGSLARLLAEAERWRVPVHLPTDPSARPRVPDDVALVMDDPVDPHRNVATALSRRNLGLFILAAAAYRCHPTASFFEIRSAPPPSIAQSRDRIAQRGTHVAVLRLPRPKLVDDILYPQLRKAERALGEAAGRLGFMVLGTASAAGDQDLILLLEVGQAELPKVRVHEGPPAGVDRGSEFLAKWTQAGASVLQGPYLTEDGKLAVDTVRPALALEDLLIAELPRLPIGKDLRREVGPASSLHTLAAAGESPALRYALGDLVDRRLPWLRTPDPSGR